MAEHPNPSQWEVLTDQKCHPVSGFIFLQGLKFVAHPLRAFPIFDIGNHWSQLVTNVNLATQIIPQTPNGRHM